MYILHFQENLLYMFWYNKIHNSVTVSFSTWNNFLSPILLYYDRSHS